MKESDKCGQISIIKPAYSDTAPKTNMIHERSQMPMEVIPENILYELKSFIFPEEPQLRTKFYDGTPNTFYSLYIYTVGIGLGTSILRWCGTYRGMFYALHPKRYFPKEFLARATLSSLPRCTSNKILTSPRQYLMPDESSPRL